VLSLGADEGKGWESWGIHCHFMSCHRKSINSKTMNRDWSCQSPVSGSRAHVKSEPQLLPSLKLSTAAS
jgi:hypothetical protein